MLRIELSVFLRVVRVLHNVEVGVEVGDGVGGVACKQQW